MTLAYLQPPKLPGQDLISMWKEILPKLKFVQGNFCFALFQENVCMLFYSIQWVNMYKSQKNYWRKQYGIIVKVEGIHC